MNTEEGGGRNGRIDQCILGLGSSWSSASSTGCFSPRKEPVVPISQEDDPRTRINGAAEKILVTGTDPGCV